MTERQLWLKGFLEKPGEFLKRQREMRGISLDDISKATNINLKLLNAIETDKHESLPHPTFVKGFIRAYCRCVGADGDDAVLHYEEYLSIESKKKAALGKTEKIETGKASPTQDLQEIKRTIHATRTFILAIAVILFSAASFIIYTQFIGKTDYEEPSSSKPVEVQTPPAVKSEPASDTTPIEEKQNIPEEMPAVKKEGADEVVIKDEAKNMPLNLVVTAHKTTWIRVEVDKEKPFEVSLRDGENITWEAKEKFLLIIGNAGGVELTFNGKPIGKIGENGQVVKLVLPQDVPHQ